MVAILALTGLFLLYLEFFLPCGIMAAGGAVLLLASGVHFYLEAPDWLSFLAYAIALLSAACLTLRIGLTRVAKKKIKHERDFASPYPEEVIGKSALAASALNPSGFVLVEDRLFPALSPDGSIEKGAPVRIVGQQENCFLVTPNPATSLTP